jgi:hypothetical protein
LRRPVGFAASVLAAIGGLMWLLSFVPGSPTAPFWGFVVFPCFALMFPVFFVTIIDANLRRRGRSGLRSPLPLKLPGWRGAAAGVIFVGVWLASMAVFFGGGLTGQPFERDGRYFTDNHGTETEVTRDDWLEQNALSSRLFAGGVLVFSGLAALALTAPDTDATDDPTNGLRRKWASKRQSLSLLDRLRGFSTWEVEAHGDPQAVLDRLRLVTPVAATPGPTSSSWEFVADWDQKCRWPARTFPLRLEGTISQTSSSTSAIDSVLAPASTYASLLPLRAIWGLFVVGIGAFIFTRAGAPPIALAFLAVWCAWGLFIVYTLATIAQRAAAQAIQTLTTTLGP